jgi:poly(3-hydroxybutyrate) depolymerase
MTPSRFPFPWVAALAILGGACSSNNAVTSEGAGGGLGPASGGASAFGGTIGSGGATGSGGAAASGGVTASGGATGAGGLTGTGGRVGSGGQTATGGVAGDGGATGSGAATGTGGAIGSGGAPGSGGATRTGGQTGAGGSGPIGGAGGRDGGGSDVPIGTGGTGAGGGTGTGGASGAGGSGPDGGAVPSAGCGRTRTLQNGTINITYNGASRNYILRAPDGYDSSRTYRLVLAYAWSGGSSTDVANAKYFTFSTLDSKDTIFAAPNASNGAGSWSNTDVAFTDAILAQIEGDLCVDTTRIFATGFSFGGAMAMALACTRADVFRAVAFFSGADLTGSCPTTLTKPIAYWASQASEDANGMDRTNPMTGEMKQAQFAAVNGCTAEPASTTFPAAGQPHTCTIYKGCSAGHPTAYCVFNGAHGWEPVDPGQTTSWAPPEAWKFITQF